MRLRLKAKFEMEPPEEIVKRFSRKFGIVAHMMERDAVRMCPVDTGRLRSSIHLERIDDFHYILCDGVYYGIFVEFGTSPHIIRPVKAQALHWVTDGEDVFAMSANHPGTVAQPFFRPAMNMAMDRLRKITKN